MNAKRILTSFRLLCAVLMLPIVAQAHFTFVTNNGAITITGYTGSAGAVTIPDATNGLPVTSIGSEAFYQCTNLESVTIPDTVTNIGHGAFAFCGNLAAVRIPDSVTNIGTYAFWHCTNLTSATISTNVTGIAVSIFDSCLNLTNTEIPGGVISISGSAFQNCASLTNVIIPNGVTNIGVSAFQNCAELTNVAISASVRGIGADAFGACGRLLAINVDAQNTNYYSLDGVLFQPNYNHTAATLVQFPGGKPGNYVLPNNVNSIGSFAFEGCAALTNITFPNSSFGIGEWAFASCSGLTSVFLPVNMNVFISSYAFESCGRLKSINFTTWAGRENHCFEDCTNLTDVTIHFFSSGVPDGTRLFSGCRNLTSIYLGSLGPAFGWNPTNQVATPTAYYLPWANPSQISGLPTAFWLPRVQSDAGFGFQTDQFGFNITWDSGGTVVVEASAHLASPVWTAVGTNTIPLTSDSSYFGDSQWTNYPGRFYRLRWLNPTQ